MWPHQIALRSITQRGVASILTMLSMALGVMLVVAVLSIHGVVTKSFENNASLGYNMIVGAKGGKEQLVLNTVYYLSAPVENIPYTYYLEFLSQERRAEELKESFAAKGHTAEMSAAELELLTADVGGLAGAGLALSRQTAAMLDAKELHRKGKYGDMTELVIPLCLGDYFGRFRVIGTSPALFNDLVYDIENNRKFEFAQGRNFEHKSEENGYFEAVVGAAVAREMEVKVGDKISPAHGSPEGHEHERKFTVVGILKGSGTPNDRAVFVNMEGFFLMEDHAKPIEADQPDEPAAPQTEAEEQALRTAKTKRLNEVLRAANPEPLPVEQREVTSLLLKTDFRVANGLGNAVNEGREAQAVFPVAVIYSLFESFVTPIQWTLLVLTAMICIVSGISILVSIYNSMSERRHEIAVMRALGAGRKMVMLIILLESVLLSIGGGLLGWLLGHTLCLIASPWIEENTGVSVGFYNFEPSVDLLRLLGSTSSAAGLRVPLELVLVPLLILLAIVVGFWPAMTAYRTDVAKSLGK